MALITVFTPTYNRARTLTRVYNSLCHQTNKDFEWLVIDDGSTDNTEYLISQWLKEHKVPIKYIKKKNGGLHTAYNAAICNIETELCVCIDSDDWMPDDAIYNILEFWNKNGSSKYAGIVGLDFYAETNKPIGGLLPNIKSIHIRDKVPVYHHKGDVKIVMRTELLKSVYPQPSFQGEKNFNPIYLILKTDLTHEYLILNRNLCYVDYQVDGMSSNIYKQYINSPKSFATLRLLYLILPNMSIIFKIKQYIHLASSVIISNDYSFLKKAPSPLIAYAFLPIGYFFSKYIRHMEISLKK